MRRLTIKEIMYLTELLKKDNDRIHTLIEANIGDYEPLSEELGTNCSIARKLKKYIKKNF